MKPNIIAAGALLAALSGVAGAQQVEFDAYTFGGLEARSIGPAAMSGRVAAIDAVAGERLTIYVGAASGGVWKSEDAGVTFEPVFDEHVQSIGAVQISPHDSDTVWVGTGEPWTRNTVSVGNGVYRSTDGGDSWQRMGLADSERISAIQVHPEDPDTVYVCATGHLWDANEQRGLFKTTDGGESWNKILYVDADTGCADLAMDPQEPDVLYTAMWEFRRSPWFFESGGPGSGLYKSTDGGESWQEIEQGLPEGNLGRIAIAVAPSRPNRLYATVEAAEKNALYRSDDMGESWTEVNSSINVQMRPFYFGELKVDPHDHDRVYKPGFTLSVSSDGGESFSGLFSGGFSLGGIHPDHHALWINPDNPQQLVLGTDGGVYISDDRAGHWRHVQSLPISQFYHVSYDTRFPYNVYGGLQDNGSWMGPTRSPGGIENRDWKNIGYGDGFWAFPDRNDPDVIYSEYQGGKLMRVDRQTQAIKHIAPSSTEDQEELRFNWNTPLHLSPNDPDVMYYGSQFVHRSTDGGESWQTISPDLTDDEPSKQRQHESGGLTIDDSTAENYNTVYTISESPVDGQVIWAGTDDGNVHVTRDGGASWESVTGNIPDLPEDTWVARIDASPHDAGTAFAAFDGHRTGDMSTYVYKTADFGASWQSLATDDIEGFARVVRQDLDNPELVFLGTEMGLYISLDGGQQWARFKENLPKVPVHDLAIHPEHNDLIVGTHGRGLYIIDDITPLRHLDGDILSQDVALLPSRDARMIINAQIQRFDGNSQFVGNNPPEAAYIHYYLQKRHLFGDLKVEVYDNDGELIQSLSGGKRRGLNRVTWPMRLEAPKMPPSSSLTPGALGPRVPEGTYTVKLIKGDKTLEGEVDLVADPRSEHSAEDRRLQQEASLTLYHNLENLTFLVDRVNHLAEQAHSRAEAAEEGLADDLEVFAESLEGFVDSVSVQHEGVAIVGQQKLREHLAEVYSQIAGYDGRPTQTQLRRKDELLAELDDAEQRADELIDERLDAVNERLEEADREPLKRLTREAWEDDDRGTLRGSALARKLRADLPGMLLQGVSSL